MKSARRKSGIRGARTMVSALLWFSPGQITEVSMRSLLISLPVLAAVLLPGTGAAQVYQLPTPAPVVTAADAPWRNTDQPIYYAGGLYYPSGPTEFFDGNIMARTG